MYKKKLVTVVVSMALLTASYTVGSAYEETTVKSEQTEQVTTSKQSAEAPQDTKEAAPAAEQPKQETPATPAPEAPSQPTTEAPQPATSTPTTEAPQPATSTPTTEAPSQPSTPGETQPSTPGETQPATPGQTEPSTPGETQPSTPGQTETSTSDETQPATPGETQTETGSEAMSESESEQESETDPPEEESESETSEYGSNEELLAHQNIVIPPKLELEFRFTKVDKRYALVRNAEGTSVYEKKSEDAREVGELEYYGLAYILDDAGDGWYYIESGNVRGFIHAEETVADEAAERIVKVKGLDALPLARLIVARTENEAFTYTHTTVQEVMASKVYAIAAQDLEIREQRKDGARTTGTLAKGGLCYILADGDKDWIFVESGNARGFVKRAELTTGAKADATVSEKGEKNLTLADVKVKPEENKACYYTFTSVQEASQEAKTRESMVNFALQFLGNPYVWGGTSLTNGCDCSGFVQSIYAYYGYSLPRVADAQSVYGMQIPISSAQPGDLIFYAKNGYVYHVSMYIGNGQVVHAAGRKLGIITSGISGNAVWATRIITG
ncbi:MAG: NlpC/P60 family protein [Lachnospiraceae bacterium]|nr:NlpC/P60 family protein [Lachnospiraceae bacterium]